MDEHRRQRRMLGSVLPSKSDNLIEDQIEALHGDLRSLQPLRELGSVPQWAVAKEVLERQVEINADMITELSYDPVKNQMNILRCWAVIKAIYDLFDIIEQTEEEGKAKTQSIKKRLEIMERTSRLPRASEVERTL